MPWESESYRNDGVNSKIFKKMQLNKKHAKSDYHSVCKQNPGFSELSSEKLNKIENRFKNKQKKLECHLQLGQEESLKNLRFAKERV